MTAHIHVLAPSRHAELLKPWLGYRRVKEGLPGADFYLWYCSVKLHVFDGPSPLGDWTEPEWLELAYEFGEIPHPHGDDGLLEVHVAFLVWCSARSPEVDLGTRAITLRGRESGTSLSGRRSSP